MINKKIGIIGCGNMGEALLKGLRTMKGVRLMAADADRIRRDRIKKLYGISVTDNNRTLVKDFEVIILAVKPKDFEGLLNDIKGALDRKKIIISIAAGITTKYIENVLGARVKVIRAMPNIGVLIMESVTGLSQGKFAGTEEMKIAKSLFSSVGEVIVVKEPDIDAFTAVGSSGLAYFFYLAECMIEAAEDAGLDPDVAKKAVLKAMVGSAKLADELKEEPSCLRAKVTSKGGTTEAAFNIFRARKFKEIVKKAVSAACHRSKELQRR